MSLTPWNRQEEWYQAMIDAAGSGGGLPEVTSADEGKVLAVNSNGEWDAESNLFVVTVTLDQSYSNVADKTYNEILAAVDAGKEVVCDRYGTRFIYNGTNAGVISFSYETTLQSHIIKISSTNSVSVGFNNYTPQVNTSDAGKVLTVNNSGVWGASELAFYVDFVFDASEQYGIRSALVDTADYKAAVESGKKIRVRIYEENGEEPLQTADAIYIGDTQLFGVSYEMYTATYCDTDAGILKPLLFALSKESNLEEQYATVSNPTGKDRFIVTLTPTALDYSGTMDKTVAEINAAYKAGQQVVFRVIIGENSSTDIPASSVDSIGYTYVGFTARTVEFSNDVLVCMRIYPTDDGTHTTYATIIYSLDRA